MILHFPSLDVFRLALTSAAVPAEIQTSPVRAVLGDCGQICVTPSAPMSEETLEALHRMGVCTAPTVPAGDALQASCWLQVISLERMPSAPQAAEKGSILFRVDAPARFAALAAEMLRLGNDRQSFRHVHDGSREFTLLRVIDPPYYSLLSANEQQATTIAPATHSSLTGYYEQAPRVWVQLGFRHPLAERIDPPAGQFILLEPPHLWRFVDEGVFQDVYQTLELRLPNQLERCTERPVSHKIEIPLRLVAGNPGGLAELWVLRERAMDQVEQLVVRSDDELIGRLAFAVIESADQPIVVLRSRPSRHAPPVLVLDALACCTYLKLPNLFIPIGKRLNPPLRRDAVGKLLAPDNQLLTWLNPESDGSFTPIAIPDSAFRPLDDWVEYILDHEGQALAAWIESHQFDFESFVCRDDAPRSSQPPAGRQASTSASANSSAATSKPVTASDKKPATTSEAKTHPDSADTAGSDTAAIKPTPDLLVERLKALEKLFVESKEPFDSPQRQAAWQKMGVLNSHLKHRTDTTVCWCNAIWNEPAPAPQLLRDWMLSELRASERTRMDIAGVDEILASGATAPKGASLLGVYLIHALATRKGVNDLKRRASGLVQFFQRHERYMPVRTIWLIALALHQLSDRDTLGLARTRDRILERLFEHGLQPECDIAGFMRGGAGNNDRGRVLRSQLPSLLAAIDRWVVEPGTSALAKNKVYAKLICAFGLAKIGEVLTCRGMVAQAVDDLNIDPIHRWMGRAFEYRIEQLVKGTPQRGTLPDDLLLHLEHMDRLTRYKVDRLRQQSRILEPHERIDPYRRWHRRYRDDLYQGLAELQDLTDHNKLRGRLQELISQHGQGERGIRVMASALELAPRLGEKFALQVLLRVDGLLDQCDDAIEKALLLQRAIYVSAHFGRIDAVHNLVDRLNQALPAIVTEYLTMHPEFNPDHKERVDTVEALLLQSFRGLRKLGMRDQIATLYGRIADHIQTPRMFGRRGPQSHAGEISLPRRLRLLLCVASGWYYFGKESEANEAVDQVRTVLFDGGLAVVDQRSLAVAYAHTVAQAPIDDALKRIQELFAVRPSGQRALPKIEDSMTTSTHFSVAQMELIEASILSLLSDESGPSAISQRWLDEDEFSIRKRIHADMNLALK